MRLLAACAIVLLLVVGLEVQKHREGPHTPSTRDAVISTTSPEFQLMTIQLRHSPGEANPTLKKFASILDILEADCPSNTRGDLGALTIESLRELRRAGIVTTPNRVLGAVLGMPDMGSRNECSAFFERYVARRRSGGPA